MSDSNYSLESSPTISIVNRVVSTRYHHDNADSGLEAKTSGENVIAVAAGRRHSLALTADGQVVAVGDDQLKQVSGIMDKTKGKRVTAVSAAMEHSLALTADGQVIAAGDNQFGQVSGIEARTRDKHIVAIVAGAITSLALTADGRVIAVGDDSDKEVSGIEARTKGKHIIAIASGAVTSLALTADGQVIAVGYDEFKQVSGIEAKTEGKHIIAIAAAQNYSLALTAEGQVIAAGYDELEQVSGIEARTEGKHIIAIAAGDVASMALTADGQVIAVGDGGIEARTKGKRVTAVSAGDDHTLALIEQVPLMCGHAAVAGLPQAAAPDELAASDIGRSTVAVSQRTTTTGNTIANGHDQSIQISSGDSDISSTVSDDIHTVHGTVTAATLQAGTNAPLVAAATAMNLDVTVTSARGGPSTPTVRLTFQELRINGQAQPTTPAPNTTVTLGGGGAKAVLNHQQPTHSGIDVTALALYDSGGLELMRLGHISAHLPVADVSAI